MRTEAQLRTDSGWGDEPDNVGTPARPVLQRIRVVFETMRGSLNELARSLPRKLSGRALLKAFGNLRYASGQRVNAGEQNAALQAIEVSLVSRGLASSPADARRRLAWIGAQVVAGDRLNFEFTNKPATARVVGVRPPAVATAMGADVNGNKTAGGA